MPSWGATLRVPRPLSGGQTAGDAAPGTSPSGGSVPTKPQETQAPGPPPQGAVSPQSPRALSPLWGHQAANSPSLGSRLALNSVRVLEGHGSPPEPRFPPLSREGPTAGRLRGLQLCSPGGWDSEVPATRHLHPAASTSSYPLPVSRPEEAPGLPVVQQVPEGLLLSLCSLGARCSGQRHPTPETQRLPPGLPPPPTQKFPETQEWDGRHLSPCSDAFPCLGEISPYLGKNRGRS